MFCPECLAEYPEGSTWCDDCDTALEGVGEEEEEDVELAPFLEITDAELFQGLTRRLEDAGIAWFVQSEESLGLLPRNGAETGAPGESVVMLYVDAARLAEARDLVNESEAVASD